MPISTTSRKAGPYPGNGVARDFSFNFKIFSSDELRVSVTNAAGAEQVLGYNTDYSVGLNPDQDADAGGVVTLNRPLATGSRLVILSDVAFLQPIDMTNQGGFYPDVVNEGFDRATAQIQQLGEAIGRAVTVPPSTPEGADLSLPEPDAGKLLAWGANGLHNLDPDSLITFAAYGDTVVDKFWADGSQLLFTLSADPAAENNLRVSVDGVVQTPGEDFVWEGGTALRFLSAPPNGTRIVVQFLRGLAETGGASKADLIPKADRVSSLASLRSWPLARPVYLEEEGREGWFRPVQGDQSANVASDPLSGVWVAPDGQDGSAGAWKRVFTGAAKIEWWGGKGNAQTDNSAALLAMASAVGYVSLSAGRYRIQSNITLDVPVEFGEGSFDIDAGVIVTLRHRIDAPANRQIIFGEGNIKFDNIGGLTGEAAKEAHSVWWGVQVGQWHGDQAPIINKAMASFGNTREGVLYFANGTHRMESTAYVARCVTIKGLRPRTTLFYPISDGWPVFETMEDGCGFEGIQFENNRSVMPLRASPLIHIKHTNAYVEDCMLTTCAFGIVVEAEGFRAHRVGWNHDAQDGAEGTAIIKLTRGRAQISGLYGYLGKTYGVANLVLIEPTAFAPGISIRDVDSACWSRAVRVNASGGFSVNGLSISGLNLSPQGGQNGPNAIEINVGTGTYISNVNIIDANINARFNDGITMNVENGGTLSDVNIDNVNIAGSSAASARTGIKVTMGAGSTGLITRVKIGANRNIVRPAGQEVVVPAGDSRVTVTVL